MTWIKLDDAYPEHRKLKRARELRAFCIALDVTGMCFCGRYNTDGFIGDDDIPDVLEVLPEEWREPVLAKLVQVGRWTRDDDAAGYWVHGYLDYNPSAAKRQKDAEAARERAERSRRNKERAAHEQRTNTEPTAHDSAPAPVSQQPFGVGAAPPSPSP
ncbi:MAG TPA: hypothetical protein VHM23_12180, partial [Actinomycetota bacterium]|nr:hypothetical protein [Actinomycetota bacterium]